MMSYGKVVSVEPSEDLIVLRLEDGRTVRLGLDGDCCSKSFFESPKEFEELVGETITSFEERETGHSTGAEEKYYCLWVTTDKGQHTFDWRNESNGYYGGSLSVEVLGKHVTEAGK